MNDGFAAFAAAAMRWIEKVFMTRQDLKETFTAMALVYVFGTFIAMDYLWIFNVGGWERFTALVATVILLAAIRSGK